MVHLLSQRNLVHSANSAQPGLLVGVSAAGPQAIAQDPLHSAGQRQALEVHAACETDFVGLISPGAGGEHHWTGHLQFQMLRIIKACGECMVIPLARHFNGVV